MGKGIEFPGVGALLLVPLLPKSHASMCARAQASVRAGTGVLKSADGQMDATDMRIGLVTTRWNAEVLVCACVGVLLTVDVRVPRTMTMRSA